MSETGEQMFNIPEKKRHEVTNAWQEHFETLKGEIAPHDKVLETLEKMSDPEAFKSTEKPLVLPGSVQFGEDPENLYIVYSHMCGQDAANRQLVHELEHAEVYKKYKVPVNYGLVVSELPSGEYFVIPLVSPKFPEDMEEAERQKIAYEANVAVSERSERDALSIKKYEDSGSNYVPAEGSNETEK